MTLNQSDKSKRPFRNAVLRGLGVVMPPLLTIVLLVWVWSAVENYVLTPVERGITQIVAWSIRDDPGKTKARAVRDADGRLSVMYKDHSYLRLDTGEWVRRSIYEEVLTNPGPRPLHTAGDYYRRYVELRFLRRAIVLPVFLCLFVLALYFLGKFMAARVGRMTWESLERVINQLPIVRNVYSSVKKVSDFVFSEREVGFTRVVAVQYPRRGIWTVAFVTGESMLDVRSAANEPVVSLLIPTSPMPATGFTITVLKRETIDLSITVDQAIQFIVSCGVVVPNSQLYREENFQARMAEVMQKARDADRLAGPDDSPASPKPQSGNGAAASDDGAEADSRDPSQPRPAE